MGFESRDLASLCGPGCWLHAGPLCRFDAKSFFLDVRDCFALLPCPRPGALWPGYTGDALRLSWKSTGVGPAGPTVTVTVFGSYPGALAVTE